MKNVSIENTIKFQDIEEFYLPENCLICGDETENRIEKSEYGSYTSTKDYKKNYKFKLPICDECNSNINLKAGKSGIILWLSVILGISLGIMVYYLTYSLILSVAVFTVLFIFPFLKYRAKIRPRIKLSDFLHMKVIPNEELVQFTFINKDYAKFVNKINSERIKAKKIEAERIEAERIEAERIEAERIETERIETERIEAERIETERIETERIEAERIETERIEAERIEAERFEAERIKEKEKSETVEKTPTLATGKLNEPIQAKNPIVDGAIVMNSVIPPTKDISKIKELIEIPAIKEIHSIKKKCPKCGFDLNPEWKFCASCSEKIDE